MKEKLENLKNFALSNWTPSEKCLLVADVLLLGVLIGWLTSPLRDGIHLFSDNSYDVSHVYEEEEEEEE